MKDRASVYSRNNVSGTNVERANDEMILLLIDVFVEGIFAFGAWGTPLTLEMLHGCPE